MAIAITYSEMEWPFSSFFLVCPEKQAPKIHQNIKIDSWFYYSFFSTHSHTDVKLKVSAGVIHTSLFIFAYVTCVTIIIAKTNVIEIISHGFFLGALWSQVLLLSL